MFTLPKGRFRARLAETADDLIAAQRLRYVTFHAARDLSVAPDGLDEDSFDHKCRHMLVEDAKTGTLVCCFRMMHLARGSEIDRSYSAQYYELSALRAFDGPMVEMGRFCIHPDWRDPDILRVAWAAMTRYVDGEGVEMLFGCSSFEGILAEEYHDAFALLTRRHLAPPRWLPRVKAPAVFRFAERLKLKKPNLKIAQAKMPPLLKTYLMMGGWVSDHAVIDRDLNTLHVFTGLEIRAVPPGRARLLRALAG